MRFLYLVRGRLKRYFLMSFFLALRNAEVGCFMCVCVFFKGIHILEKTLEASPSAATTAEPYLFNLCALFMGAYFRVQC